MKIKIGNFFHGASLHSTLRQLCRQSNDDYYALPRINYIILRFKYLQINAAIQMSVALTDEKARRIFVVACAPE